MDATESKRGRPKQPAHERVKHALPVKFSLAQIENLRERAENAGCTLSGWVKRELGLDIGQTSATMDSG